MNRKGRQMITDLVIIVALILAFLLTIKTDDKGFYGFMAIIFIVLAIPYIMSNL